MLIADALITKQYWEPVFDQLSAALENKKWTKIRGVPVYTTYYKKSLAYVAAVPVNGTMEIYGWVLLDKPRTNWACWEVGQSFVFSAVRGQGWGRLIYDSIIKSGVILASGSQQSKTGRRMWKTMVKNPDYHIWAHDFANLKRHAPVLYDEESDELWSALNLYIDDRAAMKFGCWEQKEDIRLIAIRRK